MRETYREPHRRALQGRRDQPPGALPPGWSKLPHSGELVRRAQEKPGRLPALAGGKGSGMPD